MAPSIAIGVEWSQGPTDSHGRVRHRFRNRSEAGFRLAGLLRPYERADNCVVLALPRGGVPVGAAVARELRLPLHVFIVRKLGFPGQPELAMGAIATGGVRVLDNDIVDSLRVPEHVIETVTKRETLELRRREELYRGDDPLPDVAQKTVLLVDDGIATGSSMLAAIRALRQLRAGRIVVATSVVASGTIGVLRSFADEVVSVLTPEDFHGVSQWYDDFTQTTDAEVCTLLEENRKQVSANFSD